MASYEKNFKERKSIRKSESPEPGQPFLLPPVLTERWENAVPEPPTAMGINQAFTSSVGSPV